MTSSVATFNESTEYSQSMSSFGTVGEVMTTASLESIEILSSSIVRESFFANDFIKQHFQRYIVGLIVSFSLTLFSVLAIKSFLIFALSLPVALGFLSMLLTVLADNILRKKN